MAESQRNPNTSKFKQCDTASELSRFYTDDDIMKRRVQAQKKIIRNFNIFKRNNQLNISKKIFITCECGLDCRCYTHAQKTRLPIHMCLRKGELEWLYYAQPFRPKFEVQWKCDLCDHEFNCGQIWNCVGFNI